MRTPDGQVFRPLQASCDEQGGFRIQDLTLDQPWSIQAQAGGFAPSELVCRTPRLPELTLELRLRRLSLLVVRVLSATGSPISDARVNLTIGNGRPGPLSTAEPGIFRWPFLLPESHVLEAEAEGYVPVRRSFDAREGKDEELDLVLAVTERRPGSRPSPRPPRGSGWCVRAPARCQRGSSRPTESTARSAGGSTTSAPAPRAAKATACPWTSSNASRALMSPRARSGFC